MTAERFETPPVGAPVIPRPERVPRTGDEPPLHRDPQHPDRRPKERPQPPRPAPNSDGTGHGIDLET